MFLNAPRVGIYTWLATSSRPLSGRTCFPYVRLSWVEAFWGVGAFFVDGDFVASKIPTKLQTETGSIVQSNRRKLCFFWILCKKPKAATKNSAAQISSLKRGPRPTISHTKRVVTRKTRLSICSYEKMEPPKTSHFCSIFVRRTTTNPSKNRLELVLFLEKVQWYCWWKKSQTTTWDV